jgi:capsular exopolysaccharide synthesis family protein
MEHNQPQIPNKILKQINSSFDLKRLMGTMLSHWYWFVLTLTIAITSGFLYLRYTAPLYIMKSSILIDESGNPAKNVLNKLDQEGGGQGGNSVNLYNEMFILRSQDLIARVVDSLSLNTRYWAIGRVKQTELYLDCPIKVVFDSTGYFGKQTQLNIRQIVEGQFEVKQDKNAPVRVMANAWVDRDFGRFKVVYTKGPQVNRGYLQSGTDFLVKIDNPIITNGNVLSIFKVIPSDGRTSLLELNYTDNIRQRGVDFLNVLIHFYQKKELENINHTAEKTREFINQRKATMIEDLQSMDTAVENIQLNNEIISPEAQTTTFLGEKTASEDKISAMLTSKEAVNNLKKSVIENKSEIIAGVGIDDPYLGTLVTQYNELQKKLDHYQKTLGPSNPFIQSTSNEISSLRKRILEASNKILASLNISIEANAKNAAEYDSRIKNVPSVENSIKSVKRDYNALQQIYLYLYQKGVENEISVYAASNKSKVVVAPYSSPTPISPVSKTVYSIALLLGLLIPSSILIVRELLNNKVINENDIESLTTIPVIGTISYTESGNGRDNSIVVGPHVRTGVAEQFRLIRANLEFMSASNNKKVFMVTSSSSGEGKSFVSINLGITMTLAKKRVIIMEFDLRKPKITSYLGLNNDGGISGYLAGLNELDGVIKASGIHENLYIANCGPIPPNPGELLVLPSTRELIEELQEMFDVIIIDTAPIGLVSDALVLSKYAGINLFVVRQSVTVKDQIRMFDVLHNDGKIQNPAIIFNGVEYLKKYGYGYGSNSYGYGYSYGYGSYGHDTKKVKKKKKKNSLGSFFLK